MEDITPHVAILLACPLATVTACGRIVYLAGDTHTHMVSKFCQWHSYGGSILGAPGYFNADTVHLFCLLAFSKI